MKETIMRTLASPIFVAFAILACIISLNAAHAYDCPTNGCYGYTDNQAQAAANQEAYQRELQRQNEQIIQQQYDIQNQLNQTQNGY